MAEQSFGQQYSFIQFSLREGLAQSQVRSLYQDSRGYIWAGTLGGASKFNGKNFENIDRQNGLLNNQVNCTLELHDGSIVLGEVGGISLVNALDIKSYSLPGEMKETTVNALFEDENGVLWIGTETGICTLENGNLIALTKQPPPFSSHIKSFLKQENGRFLITAKEAIYEMTDGVASVFFSPENKETTFFDLEEYPKNVFWIATKGEGMLRWSPGEKSFSYGANQGLWSTTITGITRDHLNRLWLTSRFGFFLFESEVIRAFTEKEGLKTPDIRDLIEDREGNIWLATYGSGMLRFTGEAFVSYTKLDGLSSDAVMSIQEDPSSVMWLSTFDKGVCQLSGDTVEKTYLSTEGSGDRIWTSLRDSKGDLWFGESDGLYNLSEGKMVVVVSDSLPERMVLSLADGEDGKMLIGTSGGLCYLENGVIRSWQDKDGYPETRVRGIKKDRAGNIWMATRDGVFKFDGTRFQNFTEDHGLPDRSSYCIEVDATNRIWVGTQNGLALLSGSKFTSVSVDNAPGSKTINFIRFHDGYLWVGTLNGLYCLNLQVNQAEGQWTFQHFGLDEGLRSLETNLNAVFVDSKGLLWFGTPEGVMRMDKSKIDQSPNRVLPLVHLTRIKLNLQDQDWSKFPFAINQITGLPAGLEVPYKNNHFTFYFDAVSTTHPSDIEYQYVLEGFDEEWQSPSKIDFVAYSNLPYSSFIFKVRARVLGGNWSEPVVYAFVIRPPFWLSWWFIVFEIIAVAGIVTAITHSRRRILHEKFEKEQYSMRSRMLTLEQQSLNSSMNRHFIFNALNSIQYYINRQDKQSANKYLSDFAKLIRKNLDSSQENLTSLREEIERLELYMKLEHMRFKDKFDYSVNVDPGIDLDTIKVPAMLLQPFLENSIWHGLLPKDAPGIVEVDISKVNQNIEFTITDNGIGIEKSLKNKTGTDNHISKGMQITSGRIDLIKKMTGVSIELLGPYQLNDEGGQPMGTRVKIVLPVNFHELFVI